jgi:hypothetical protein
MLGKTIRHSLCVGVAFLGLLAAGCGAAKDYRQIVVVDGDRTEFVTWGKAPDGPREIWQPGQTLVFRTSSPVPGVPRKATGKAGYVYRINDALEMEEVGTFALSMPNDTLAYQYGR